MLSCHACLTTACSWSRVDEEAQYEAGASAPLDEYIGQGAEHRENWVSINARSARRGARSVCCTGRPDSADDAGGGDRQGDWRGDAADGGGGIGRPAPGGDATNLQEREVCHRRDTPDGAGDRGDSLSGDGGLRGRHQMARAGAARVKVRSSGSRSARRQNGPALHNCRRFGIVHRLDTKRAGLHERPAVRANPQRRERRGGSTRSARDREDTRVANSLCGGA